MVAAGQLEIADRLIVDVEHRGRRAVFGRHVGNRCAIAEREARCAFAVELQIRGHDLLLTQELGQRQHDIGSRDTGLPHARQLDADDVGQTHPRGASQHDAFGLEPAHANRDDTQRIDHRRMRIGADECVGKRHTVAHLHHGAHPLEIDLMQDAVAGRDHVDVTEGTLRPVDEMESILVAAVFDGAVLGERIGIEAAAFDGERMVHDELSRHDGIDRGRVAAACRDCIAQPREIDERGLAEDVVTDDTRGKPRKIDLAFAFDQLHERGVEQRGLAPAHEVLGEHARRVRQRVVGAGHERIDGGARVEVVEFGAGQRFAKGSVHRRFSIGTNVRFSGPV